MISGINCHPSHSQIIVASSSSLHCLIIVFASSLSHLCHLVHIIPFMSSCPWHHLSHQLILVILHCHPWHLILSSSSHLHHHLCIISPLSSHCLGLIFLIIIVPISGILISSPSTHLCHLFPVITSSPSSYSYLLLFFACLFPSFCPCHLCLIITSSSSSHHHHHPHILIISFASLDSLHLIHIILVTSSYPCHSLPHHLAIIIALILFSSSCPHHYLVCILSSLFSSHCCPAIVVFSSSLSHPPCIIYIVASSSSHPCLIFIILSSSSHPCCLIHAILSISSHSCLHIIVIAFLISLSFSSCHCHPQCLVSSSSSHLCHCL